jgi:hypothetical protein
MKWVRFFTKSEWMMVILTFVIAATGVIGIVLVIQGGEDTKHIVSATEAQACAARSFAESAGRINTQMEEAVKKLDAQDRAIENSRRSSLYASSKALNATIENFRLEQRAWVSAIVTMPVFDFTNENTVKIMISNSGRTFALKTVIRDHISVATRELVSFEELNVAKESETTSVALVAPNTSYESDMKIPSDVASLLKEKLGTHGFTYIWGDITYSDVMTEKRHITEFCGYRPENGDATFIQCKFHTDAN